MDTIVFGYHSCYKLHLWKIYSSDITHGSIKCQINTEACVYSPSISRPVDVLWLVFDLILMVGLDSISVNIFPSKAGLWHKQNKLIMETCRLALIFYETSL